MAAKPWVVVPLVLPVNGTDYEVTPIGYEAGLELQQILNGSHPTLTTESPERDLFALVMGDTWARMLSDNLPFPVLLRAGVASVQFQTSLVAGLDCVAAVAVGEVAWEAGTDPEALAAALTAAAKERSTASKPSTSSESASATRRPASTRTTTSPPATRRTSSSTKKAPAKKAPSRGTGSGPKSTPDGPS